MSSGSGNTGFVLGASTTTAGIATLPSTGQDWVMATMLSIVAGGVVMLSFYAYAAFVKRQS